MEVSGLEVVAEGVENQSQWDFLRNLECSSFQDYYQTPAVDAESFEALLRTQPPRG